MSPLILTNAAVGILLALVSLPMIDNKVKPNRIYGFRTRRTLSSPEIWYAANHYAGIQLFIAGICTALLAVLLALIPGVNLLTYSTISAVAIIVILTVAVIRSMIFVNSLDDSGRNDLS
jgi:uncharacterized membrane protein